MASPRRTTFLSSAQRYLFTGMLTLIPIWVTWLVFEFLLNQMSQAGIPWVRALSNAVARYSPAVAAWMLEPWFESIVAVIVTIVGLYLLGWAASRVIGKRLLQAFDIFMDRIPLVHTIYGATKKMVTALQQKPEEVQRVVFIEFPSPEMKTIGFVTRVLTDEHTGMQLAAVYVPTTPNPTSGYLEIVPLDKVVSTDWTMDEAMSFIISGGAISPETLGYSRSSSDAPVDPGKASSTQQQ